MTFTTKGKKLTPLGLGQESEISTLLQERGIHLSLQSHVKIAIKYGLLINTQCCDLEQRYPIIYNDRLETDEVKKVGFETWWKYDMERFAVIP